MQIACWTSPGRSYNNGLCFTAKTSEGRQRCLDKFDQKNNWCIFSSTQRQNRLRLCTTRRKVAGSNPGGVIGFFIYIILPAAIWPSDLQRPGQKWVPEIFPGGKGDWCLVLTTSPPSFTDCLEFKLLETYGAVIGMYRKCLTLVFPVQLASESLVFSNLDIWPPRGPRQISKGPQ
jgi:hypothetical protein